MLKQDAKDTLVTWMLILVAVIVPEYFICTHTSIMWIDFVCDFVLFYCYIATKWKQIVGRIAVAVVVNKTVWRAKAFFFWCFC